MAVKMADGQVMKMASAEMFGSKYSKSMGGLQDKLTVRFGAGGDGMAGFMHPEKGHIQINRQVGMQAELEKISKGRVGGLPADRKGSASFTIKDSYEKVLMHEVGHALFTPNEWDWLDEGIPAGVVNVVEDARIEKLMKRKYMGIAKSFFKGYTELHQDNFFEINVDKVDQMNLADRANLYFKIGAFLDLTFTSEEQEIIDLIKNCETFKDTLSAAKALHLFCKEEIQKQKEALESQEGG